MPLYRHNRIRRFRIGQFQFDNHMLKVDPSDHEAFIKLFAQMSPRKQKEITEINEAAYQNLERPVDTTKVFRGGATAAANPRVLAERANADARPAGEAKSAPESAAAGAAPANALAAMLAARVAKDAPESQAAKAGADAP